jgi:hypothetical protein
MEMTVMDSFEIKGRVAMEYGSAGVVVVLAGDAPTEEPLEVGKPVLILRSDGWMRRSVMGEVKEHGIGGRSVFLKGLTGEEVPIGSRLRWGEPLWPSDMPSGRSMAVG